MEGTFRSGSVLVGKYRVESVLAREGICVVLRVTHLRAVGQPVFKMVLPDATASLAVHARFLKEAQATAHLRGEHVARIIDVGLFPDGAPFLIMEHLHGSDLTTELARRGALSPAEAVDTLLQCCDALAEAHAHGILHRDLRPGNVGLLARPDGAAMVKLLDLGISKTFVAIEGPLGRTDIATGTASYMAPEQYRPNEELDARTDIWALGAVLYECLTGQRACPGASERAAPRLPPRPMDFRVPEALQATVMRCLEADRDARFPTAAALAAALAPFARDPHIAAVVVERAKLWSQGIDPGLEPPPQYAVAGPVSVPGWWSPTRRRYAAIGAVALAVSLGGIAAAALIRPGHSRRTHEAAESAASREAAAAQASASLTVAPAPGAAGGTSTGGGTRPAAAAPANDRAAAKPDTAAASPAKPDPAAASPAKPDPAAASPAKPDTATASPAKPDTAAASPAKPDPAAASPAKPDPAAASPAKPDSAGANAAKSDSAGANAAKSDSAGANAAKSTSAAAGATNAAAGGEAAQKLGRCSELQAQKQWQALDDCASELAGLGGEERAERFHTTARQERENERLSGQVREALRDGDLPEAQAALELIGSGSVYLGPARDSFTTAERQRVDEVRRKAQSLASAHDCTALKRFIAQLTGSTTDRVVAAAQTVNCDDDAAPERVARSAPAAAPPPTAKQRKEACDSVDVSDLMTRAAIQYDAGSPTSALSLARIALGCKQTDRMYWLAVMYACAARDLANARLYFPKVPANLQPGIEQKCQQANLDVRSR